MNKKTAPILVLLSTIMLLSTLLYSCESNMKPAYVGTWVSYDSSAFKEDNGLVKRKIWEIGETNMTITYSGKENNTAEYIDDVIIKGDMTVFSQFFTMRVNTASIYNFETKQWSSLTKADPTFNQNLESNSLDSLNHFSFKVLNNMMTLVDDDTTYLLHHQ